MNRYVMARLHAIQEALIAHHAGSARMPSAMAGSEREALINLYLSQALPPLYRFGRGSITDAQGNQSGEVDVVMELPFTPSFPMPAGTDRLYPIESVGAVIEVKSNLSRQWKQVEEKVQKIRQLERHVHFAISETHCLFPLDRVPCYAIGYAGYETLQGLQKRLRSTPEESRPDGALVIDKGCFIGRRYEAKGPWGLFCLAAELLQWVVRIITAEPKVESNAPRDIRNKEKV